MTVERKVFHETEKISQDVKKKVDEAMLRNEKIDYLSFVPDGEPTLELKLGEQISALKAFGIPIAVLTNASLIWKEPVRKDIMKADLVSLKLDAIREDLWRMINRPHKNLRLKAVLEGIERFSEEFKGAIISETMLIDGIDYGDQFKEIAEFLGNLKKLDKAYIAIPTRLPAEEWVRPAKEETINRPSKSFLRSLALAELNI